MDWKKYLQNQITSNKQSKKNKKSNNPFKNNTSKKQTQKASLNVMKVVKPKNNAFKIKNKTQLISFMKLYYNLWYFKDVFSSSFYEELTKYPTEERTETYFRLNTGISTKEIKISQNALNNFLKNQDEPDFLDDEDNEDERKSNNLFLNNPFNALTQDDVQLHEAVIRTMYEDYIFQKHLANKQEEIKKDKENKEDTQETQDQEAQDQLITTSNISSLFNYPSFHPFVANTLYFDTMQYWYLLINNPLIVYAQDDAHKLSFKVLIRKRLIADDLFDEDTSNDKEELFWYLNKDLKNDEKFKNVDYKSFLNFQNDDVNDPMITYWLNQFRHLIIPFHIRIVKGPDGNKIVYYSVLSVLNTYLDNVYETFISKQDFLEQNKFTLISIAKNKFNTTSLLDLNEGEKNSLIEFENEDVETSVFETDLNIPAPASFIINNFNTNLVFYFKNKEDFKNHNSFITMPNWFHNVYVDAQEINLNLYGNIFSANKYYFGQRPNEFKDDKLAFIAISNFIESIKKDVENKEDLKNQFKDYKKQTDKDKSAVFIEIGQRIKKDEKNKENKNDKGNKNNNEDDVLEEKISILNKNEFNLNKNEIEIKHKDEEDAQPVLLKRR